eukprot:scaffold52464_cov63-Phaeocystis_antarctica.AAC.3
MEAITRRHVHRALALAISTSNLALCNALARDRRELSQGGAHGHKAVARLHDVRRRRHQAARREELLAAMRPTPAHLARANAAACVAIPVSSTPAAADLALDCSCLVAYSPFSAPPGSVLRSVVTESVLRSLGRGNHLLGIATAERAENGNVEFTFGKTYSAPVSRLRQRAGLLHQAGLLTLQAADVEVKQLRHPSAGAVSLKLLLVCRACRSTIQL